ncbi:MAG: c-type cytochrome domain-containing protein [Planctomycetota bacterium]
MITLIGMGLFALALGAGAASTSARDDTPPNFVDHVQPILRESCLGCHRGSRAKNGLDLSSVPKILAGGSSGPAVVAGDPDGSLLLKLVEHTQGPFMPPDDDAIPEASRATLRAWIAGGARVDAQDKGAVPPPKEAAPLPVHGAAGGPAPMPPAGLSREPITWSALPSDVTALAASPGAPLAAVGGRGQVSLYALPSSGEPNPDGPRANTPGALLGVLAFPEGRPERLHFNATGAVLLIAGGRAGERGVAAGFDVATGARLFTVGDEPETALDADVTADLSVVALGGPDRVLRAYDPATGRLRWEARAHTDWVTAVAASPDSALIASGDRAGGVVVWEAFTGREFQRLDPARGAITGLAWRRDGARFAATDDAGGVRVIDAESGRVLASWTAHRGKGGALGEGGALGVAWLVDGGLVTVGRDGGVRVSDGAGKARGKPLMVPAPELPAPAQGQPLATLSVAACADGARVLVGDQSGRAYVLPLGSETGSGETGRSEAGRSETGRGETGRDKQLILHPQPAPRALRALRTVERALSTAPSHALHGALLRPLRATLRRAWRAERAAIEAAGGAVNGTPATQRAQPRAGQVRPPSGPLRRSVAPALVIQVRPRRAPSCRCGLRDRIGRRGKGLWIARAERASAPTGSPRPTRGEFRGQYSPKWVAPVPPSG